MFIPYFQLKIKLVFYLIFDCFFNNAGKSSALFMEILLSHETFLHVKILPRPPFPPTSPQEKIRPENVCILPNNQY